MNTCSASTVVTWAVSRVGNRYCDVGTLDMAWIIDDLPFDWSSSRLVSRFSQLYSQKDALIQHDAAWNGKLLATVTEPLMAIISGNGR